MRRCISTWKSFMLCVITLILLASIPKLKAQEYDDRNPFMEIEWQIGPCDAQLGNLASISVPEGYMFSRQEGAIKFMELAQNPTSGDELGIIVSQKSDWFVIFEFDNSGYVSDSEKDNLDADAILSNIRQNTKEANKIRESKGWISVNVLGWKRQPYYDSMTHNLTWAIRGVSENEEVINHSVRLLGRRGVMHADLVADPADIDAGIIEFDSILTGFSFNPGDRYSEFRKGDKLAGYGLTALIAGGAGAIAAKTGLLAKLWKFIVIIFVAIGSAVMKFFRAIFKRGVEKAPELPKQN